MGLIFIIVSPVKAFKYRKELILDKREKSIKIRKQIFEVVQKALNAKVLSKGGVKYLSITGKKDKEFLVYFKYSNVDDVEYFTIPSRTIRTLIRNAESNNSIPMVLSVFSKDGLYTISYVNPSDLEDNNVTFIQCSTKNLIQIVKDNRAVDKTVEFSKSNFSNLLVSYDSVLCKISNIVL